MSRRPVWIVVVVVAFAGCRTSGQPASRPPARTVEVQTAGTPSGSPAAPQSPPISGVDADPLAEREPCAARLHDIAGTMLLYFAVHKRLPAELNELHALADIDQELKFACPTTGQPYVYVPSGLRFPGKEERLVLHDAEASHAGARWGILAAPPKGERPASMWAVRLTETVFRSYSGVSAPNAGP